MTEKRFPTSNSSSSRRRRPKRREEWCLLSVAAILLVFLPSSAVSLSVWAFGGSDHCISPRKGVGEVGYRAAMATLGGARESGEGAHNNVEIQDLARFAVDEHNKKENSLAELSRVVKAEEQVVAGTLHHLTLEVIEGGQKKLYEAKVWVKPWLDFKELQEFKFVGDQPTPLFTSADLGAKRTAEEGWREVPAHDPVVQDAAAHAMKTIQDRSNSLNPYELLEIIHSRAEVIDEVAKFDMLLKVKRGDNEEKFKVEVHKNLEGFLLNQMQQEP